MKSMTQDAPSSSSAVTKRERTIIDWLVCGATAREVAAELRLSPHTVRAHIRNVYAKLGVANRIELVRWRDDQPVSEGKE